MTKLGRGLEALINAGPESIDKTTGITTLKVDFIKPNKYQPRKLFKKEKLEELARSLKENGMIQPIIVTKKDQSSFELVAGERRLEAAKIAGFKEVPVIIRSVSAKEQLQFAIIENVQREDLNAIEEALAYKQLHDDFKMTHAQISDIMGKDRATITNAIRILKLNNNIQNLILENKITSGHARAILQVDEKLHEQFADYIFNNKLSVRRTEIEAKRINETGKIAKPKEKGMINSIYNSFEKNLFKKFNVKVRISHKADKGKVSFYFSSKKELENLIKMLN
ncbi:MAG: ParB/RepB/Spo0J family partition protein [Candidatus Cloacimonetes bacterium]|nr:ParB/RepB/Spo0J family partition protein [Candidatus Cloacimonadota bacterium]